MKKTNQGFCAEIFEAENGRLLKLYFPYRGKMDASQEYQITKAVNEMGIPSPTVYDFVEQDGRCGFTMEKLQDNTMLHHIHRHLKEAFLLAKELAQLHYNIHCHLTDSTIIPSQEDVYLQKINSRCSLSSAEKAQLAKLLKQKVSSEQTHICHGDFHPMNILYQGEKPVVIDWAFTCSGDPRGDVAGTYLITKIMAVKAAAKGPVEKFMYNTFTPLFAEIYLHTYIKLSGYSKQEIKQWIPIRAATYLDYVASEAANRKLYRIVKRAI